MLLLIFGKKSHRKSISDPAHQNISIYCINSKHLNSKLYKRDDMTINNYTEQSVCDKREECMNSDHRAVLASCAQWPPSLHDHVSSFRAQQPFARSSTDQITLHCHQCPPPRIDPARASPGSLCSTMSYHGVKTNTNDVELTKTGFISIVNAGSLKCLDHFFCYSTDVQVLKGY